MMTIRLRYMNVFYTITRENIMNQKGLCYHLKACQDICEALRSSDVEVTSIDPLIG